MSRPIDPPTFEPTTKPRVLIEATEWAMRESMATVVRNAGYEVAACAGPEGTDQPCALIADGICPAVENADIVVHLLRHQDLRNRDVLRNLRRRHPNLPVVVQVPEPRVSAFPEDFAGCHLLPFPAGPGALRETIDRALGSSSAAQDPT
ncbi:MAG: hypothetical protein OEU32_15090 [Acidimicrobiia bacterium]|nr:hypothetical protein [Acidimicrobiia bacterium]